MVERSIAALRITNRAGDHHGKRPARHDPMRNRLFDILQSLTGKNRAIRIGVKEARRYTYL